MAEIISSLEPGQYPVGQTVTVTFPPNTRKAIITRDDRAPVLTEVIAYDTGYIEPVPSMTPTAENPTPGTGPIVERPFIAVTQDGRGNVTFDGGFPKFYNTHIVAANGGVMPPLPYTGWEQLPPAARYMNNCIKFCANPRKVARGNRKILLMGDSTLAGRYSVMASLRYNTPGAAAPGSSFKDTFEGIAQLGNWDLTIVDSTIAGGKLDYNLDYFDQYAAVIFMASAGYPSRPPEDTYLITERCAQELSLYRMDGNGIIIITDHTSANYTSIEDALENAGVFSPDANRVAKYFSAYFTGDVNRVPVLVGTIRQQLIAAGGTGQHPLLDGLADNDYIFAGGSESLTRPQLFDGDIVPHTQPWSLTMNTAGTYRINILVQLEDGTILTKPMRFIIINPSDVNLRDSFNRMATGGVMTTYKPAVDYTVDAGNNDRTLKGKIVIGSVLVGYFTTTKSSGSWVTTYHPLSGQNSVIPVKNADVLKFVITDPFEFTATATINIPDSVSYWQSSGSYSTFSKKLKSHPFFNGIAENAMWGDVTKFADESYPKAAALGNWINGQIWKQVGKARMPFGDQAFIDPAKLPVYATEAAWNLAKPAVGNVGDAVIIANTNKVFYWDDLPMTWQVHPQNADILFTLGRSVINTLDNSNWVIQRNTTVKV